MAQRRIDDWLRAFIEYASYGEAPLKTLFWTGVSTIAGALRRRVWIDQRYFQWTPNFYVILVAPPGIISKSTTANIGMNLLREVPDVTFGPDVITWQALIKSMSESTQLVHDPVTDAYLPMSAITICSDEFGTFLDPNDRSMVDALVSLWDGKQGVFKKETKTSGNESIENPWINIIACTTPGWIAGNFPEYMIGGGFTSRCVFVYADRKRQLVAYPAMNVPDNLEQLRQDLIHDLAQIAEMIGEVHLSPEAIDWGIAWYEKHWSQRPRHLDNDRFGGYLARKQTHIHKLAIIISAARNSSRIIQPDELAFADEMISTLETDMPRVFATIGQNDIGRGMAELVQCVQQCKRIAQTDLYRMMFRTMTSQVFQEALNSARMAGYITTIQEGNEIFVISKEAPKQDAE